MSKKHVFRVTFMDQDNVYQIYARGVCDSDMYGFIEVDELVFGEHTSLVVDPSEEQLKLEFADVKCSYIPVHAIVRIDVVEKEGVARATGKKSNKANISQFPSRIQRPSIDD